MAKSCKFYKQQRQVSYDNGVTWIPLDEYQKGALIEVNSSDCTSPSTKIYRWTQTDDTICVNSYTGKFKATYTGGTTYDIPCDGNTTLTSGNTKPSGYNSSAMTSCEIGSCVNTIGYGAFLRNTSLTSVTLPDNSLVNIDDYAFSTCWSLTNIDIPNGVITIGENAFSYCTNLENVTIPDTVTSIGEKAFRYNHNLKYIKIPTGVTSIESMTFDCCYAFTSVTIPESITKISDNAFFRCSGLTEVVIPSGVTSIGWMAFEFCTSLQSITCLATTPPTAIQQSGWYAFSSTNCPIYVPAGSVDTYKTATGWSDYASRIQAIP